MGKITDVGNHARKSLYGVAGQEFIFRLCRSASADANQCMPLNGVFFHRIVIRHHRLICLQISHHPVVGPGLIHNADNIDRLCIRCCIGGFFLTGILRNFFRFGNRIPVRRRQTHVFGDTEKPDCRPVFLIGLHRRKQICQYTQPAVPVHVQIEEIHAEHKNCYPGTHQKLSPELFGNDMTAHVQPDGHQAGADHNIHHNRPGKRKGIAPGNRRRCGDTEKVDQLQRLSPEQIDKVKGNAHTAPDGGHRHQRAPNRIQPEQQNHIHDKNAQYIQCHVPEFHLIENIIVDVFDQQESTDIRRQNNGKIPRPYSLFQFFAVLSSQLFRLHDKHRQPCRDRNRGRQKNKNQISVFSVIQICSHDLPVLCDQKNQKRGKIAGPENQVFFGSWKMSRIPYDLCA